MNKKALHLTLIASSLITFQAMAQPTVVAIPQQMPITSASGGTTAALQPPVPEAIISASKHEKLTLVPVNAKDEKKKSHKTRNKKKVVRKIEAADEGAVQPRDEVVEGLRSEINALRDHRVVDASVKESTQRPTNSPLVEIKTFYNYTPGSNYVLHAGVNRATDIELQPGENLTGPIIAGDTVRWVVAKAISGSGENTTTHVIVKPIQANIETNFIITTDRHVYHLSARSTNKNYMPVLTWNYPHEEAEKMDTVRREDQRLNNLKVAPAIAAENLNFKYKVKADDDYSWTPIRVFDDGSKTFIQMSPEMKNTEAPALFIKDGDDLNLVNYRVKGDYYIVDRLFDVAELRSGKDEMVIVKKEKPWGWFSGSDSSNKTSQISPVADLP